MPNKTIYVKNTELWRKLSEYARANEQTISNVIENAIQEYLAVRLTRRERILRVLCPRD